MKLWFAAISETSYGSVNVWMPDDATDEQARAEVEAYIEWLNRDEGPGVELQREGPIAIDELELEGGLNQTVNPREFRLNLAMTDGQP